MKNEPLISVILPVHNGERFLAQSIKSVLSQTFKNIELVIVNDCSTDNSEAIVNEFAKNDSRVKYYKNEKNLKKSQKTQLFPPRGGRIPQALKTAESFASGSPMTFSSSPRHRTPRSSGCSWIA